MDANVAAIITLTEERLELVKNGLQKRGLWFDNPKCESERFAKQLYETQKLIILENSFKMLQQLP